MSQSGLTAEPRVAWPSNGISEVPFRVYTDPAQYQREQERLFKGPTWNYLCLAVELAKPGDYVATTIGETAVIVVRDAAGAINAFVNRCAHRGNLLCIERAGNVKEFSCIYHGWTYDLAGQLTGVAFEHGVKRQGGMPPEFRKDEHRLQRLRAAELGGLVFGTFSDAAPDLETYLGPDVTRGLLRVMNRTPHLLGRSTQVMPNNWKLYFENVKDTYHASILHLFLTTFRINRLSMPGGIYINRDGGNHYSYAKLDYAAEDADYKAAALRADSEFRLQDRSVVELVDEYGDGVSVQILTDLPRHGAAAGAQHDRGAGDPAARRGQGRAGMDPPRLRHRRRGDDRAPAAPGQPDRRGGLYLDGGRLRRRLRAARAAIQRRGRGAGDDGRARGGIADVPRQRGGDPRLLEALPHADGRVMDDVAIRLGIHELIGDYAERIDEDRLEEWPELFADPCRYW